MWCLISSLDKHRVSCTRSSLHNSRDIPPKISPYPSFPKRGLGVGGEESPFEKGGNRGIWSSTSAAASFGLFNEFQRHHTRMRRPKLAPRNNPATLRGSGARWLPHSTTHKTFLDCRTESSAPRIAEYRPCRRAPEVSYGTRAPWTDRDAYSPSQPSSCPRRHIE